MRDTSKLSRFLLDNDTLTYLRHPGQNWGSRRERRTRPASQVAVHIYVSSRASGTPRRNEQYLLLSESWYSQGQKKSKHLGGIRASWTTPSAANECLDICHLPTVCL